MVIYKITNIINGKVYIGQTKYSAEQRFQGHIQRANSGCMGRLYPAMRKYGIDNFICEKIDEVDANLPNAADILNEREVYWIKFYDATGKNGYNILIGGDVNRMLSPLARKNHADKLASLETRANISNGLKEYRKTHPFTEEHRRKLSESAKGNHNFGTGDTRSIGCYCIVDGEKHSFHSIKDAGEWWYKTYKPFGEVYASATYLRKIRDSINDKPIQYNNRGKKINIDYIKWFKEGD